MNKTQREHDDRDKRMRDVMMSLSDSIDKNIIGLSFLREILRDNSDRVYICHKDDELVVKGTLANYKLSIGKITERLENPFVQSGGFPRTKVHPVNRFVDEPRHACIQAADHHENLPGTDSIGILILGLLNDQELFMDNSQDSLREELIETYGYCKSPISDITADYIETLGGKFNSEKGEITVRGTDGFHWVIGSMVDPAVESFSISSYVRSGPRRIHTIDTYHDLRRCKDLNYLVRILSKSPRIMIADDKSDNDLVHFYDNDLAYSEEIVRSVSLVHAPLKRALKEGRAAGSEFFTRSGN